MPQFAYKALQGPQRIVEGSVEADSLNNAVKKILQMGFTPVDVHGQEIKKSIHKKKLRFASMASSRVSLATVTLFTRQISDLIDAGVPVLRTLIIAEQQVKDPSFKNVIEQIANRVKDGDPLSSALAQYPKIFPRLYVNMVKAGELSGNLDTVLMRLANFLEKDLEVSQQVKSSLIYPSLLVTVGAATIFILLTWVIPRITTIFEDLNETLPLPTVILLGLSSFLARFWWVILGALGIFIFWFRQFSLTVHGKQQLDKLKLKIPVLGQFIKESDIGRFARTLGTLLENGVDIITALESVKLVIDNEILKQEVQRLTDEVTNGSSFSLSLRNSSVFPEAARSMISVGEETGHIYNGLYKLASYYEGQSQRMIKAFTNLIEPSLILALGLVIGFVVMAMLLPIFRMNLIMQ